MTLTQDNRTLRIETPLGQDVFVLTGITGTESLSSPFTYWLDLVSEQRDIAADQIVGANVTFSLRLANNEERYFNGMVNAFMHGHRARTDNDQNERFIYKAEIVPWFVSLSRTSNCKIFQNKSVPEIIEQIFNDRGLTQFDLQLSATYPARDYCVQYRESDYDFIVRLMAYEGMFYFFTHENGAHTMVIADSNDAAQPCPGQETARFQPAAASGISEDDVITQLQDMSVPPSGRYVVNDYNFETPNADISSQVDSVCTMGQACDEIYDYPAVYANKTDGERIVNIRIQQQEVTAQTITGTSHCRPFACGYQFTMEEHPVATMNTDYLLTSVHPSVSEPASDTGDEEAVRYENRFACIPMEVPYRPPLIKTKPLIQGIQSAYVVGPDGEEIYTDAYGRIKIQFHWDRCGQKDENSSCFVRVAQSLAGPGFGSMFIPRIGQEVIVSFLEGDPDRPVVTGCLYNAGNMPPYELPAHQTIATVKTRSTPNDTGHNELRFDDSAGNEQIYLHAQGSRDTIVRGSHRETVGGDQHITVKGGQQKKIEGTQVVNIGGDYGSDVTGTYCQGSQGEMTIRSMADLDIGSGDGTLYLAGRDVVIWGSRSVTLKVDGSNHIQVLSHGVQIKGNETWINCGPFVSRDHRWNQFYAYDDPTEASSGRPPQESGQDSLQRQSSSPPQLETSSTELQPSASTSQPASGGGGDSAAPPEGLASEASDLEGSDSEPDMVFTEEEVYGQSSGEGTAQSGQAPSQGAQAADTARESASTASGAEGQRATSTSGFAGAAAPTQSAGSPPAAPGQEQAGGNGIGVDDAVEDAAPAERPSASHADESGD